MFGAGVLRCQSAIHGDGRFREGSTIRRVQNLGDAKIEELWCAIGSDENVAGLDVAMNDQPLMRVLDRGADLEKEFQSLCDGRALSVAVFGNGPAVDQFHYQIRSAERAAAIEKARNVRVLEAGKNLAFVFEAFDDERGILAGAN